MIQTQRQSQQVLPKVEVRGSDVAGRGAFAGEMIPAGSYVLPITGKVLKRGEFDENDYSLPMLQIGKDMFLLAQGNADDYVNHSCHPNLAFSSDGQAFMAARDITEGEELSFDYSTSEDDPDWSLVCQCGSSKCRAIVTSFGRLEKRDRERLHASALPYLREKYKP